MLQRLKRSHRIYVGLATLGFCSVSGCMSSEFGVTSADNADPDATLTRDASKGSKDTETTNQTDDTGGSSEDATQPSDDANSLTDSASANDASTTTVDSGVADTGVQDSGVVPLTPLISIPRPGGGAAFSIEAREVSQKQYQAFLEAKAGNVSGQVAACAANASYLPAYKWDPVGTPNRPVVGIDLCDARAYCAWAGRHVCGGFGGTSLSGHNQGAVATVSEWAAACTKGGAQQFPYSVATNNDSACNVLKPAATGSAEDTGSRASCVGGYAGLFDMVGNAAEWVDACEPGNTSCAIMGGSWHAGVSPVSCGTWFGGSPSSYFDDLGFRCCKD